MRGPHAHARPWPLPPLVPIPSTPLLHPFHLTPPPPPSPPFPHLVQGQEGPAHAQELPKLELAARVGVEIPHERDERLVVERPPQPPHQVRDLGGPQPPVAPRVQGRKGGRVLGHPPLQQQPVCGQAGVLAKVDRPVPVSVVLRQDRLHVRFGQPAPGHMHGGGRGRPRPGVGRAGQRALQPARRRFQQGPELGFVNHAVAVRVGRVKGGSQAVAPSGWGGGGGGGVLLLGERAGGGVEVG